jgi:hypothetical protein
MRSHATFTGVAGGINRPAKMTGKLRYLKNDILNLLWRIHWIDGATVTALDMRKKTRPR